MAHFAKLDDTNTVIGVHVVNNEIITIDGTELEQIGIDFLENIHGHSKWKQASYNSNFRKNYPGIGYTYDPILDAFIPPKLFESWILDEDTCLWKPPTLKPNNDSLYAWDEPTLSWVEIN